MPTQGHEEKRVGERASAPKREEERERERERERALWLRFFMFPSPWACPVQIGLSQECCLLYLRSSLSSSDLPLTFLCSIFVGSSLPCLLATTFWTPVSYSNCLTVFYCSVSFQEMASPLKPQEETEERLRKSKFIALTGPRNRRCVTQGRLRRTPRGQGIGDRTQGKA